MTNTDLRLNCHRRDCPETGLTPSELRTHIEEDHNGHLDTGDSTTAKASERIDLIPNLIDE